VEQEVNTPEPDEQECRRYYERNLKSFRAPAIYEASHILFAARRDDAEAFARAMEQARTVLAELQRQPERFADLAQAHSACPSAAQGGNLGQLTRGQTTPEFEAALARMPAGAIADEPVATRYGLHIVRLERRIDERQLPFELVAGRIADYLREQVVRRATAQYIARLVSRAAISGIEIEGADAHRVN
jgi:peptidyl-prolyl cis-trans isomerase C